MPSYTTVRVTLAAKKKLDRVQGLIQSETGRKISHSEVVERISEIALDQPVRLTGVSGGRRRPSRQWLEEFFANLPDSGFESDSSRIDEELYGGS